MHLLALADHIRKRPGFYIGNEKSLKRLISFLDGYQFGAAAFGGRVEGVAEVSDFGNWLAKRLSFSNPSSGWYNMITAKGISDEAAYDYFFELLDQFQVEGHQ